MDPILAEIYSTVLPAVPYVAGAYLVIWAILIIYLFIVDRKVKNATRELIAIEETLAYRERKERGEIL